jgi:hypothetical protein
VKIYVASSWRNGLQQTVVKQLKAAGYDVYDFRNPGPGQQGFFGWHLVDPNWSDWQMSQYKQALAHPIAQAAFNRDLYALLQCDVCVMVAPCGKSAHLELGYAAGLDKYTIILDTSLHQPEPELMWNFADAICTTMRHLDEKLKEFAQQQKQDQGHV